MSERRSADDPNSSTQGLSSRDEETRRSAVAALAARPLSETRDLLMRAMGDESWRVRKEAVEIFLASPVAGQYAEQLFELLRSPDNAGLRNSSVEALVRLGKASIPVLSAHADDKDCDVRKFVVDILGGIGDVSSLPLLIAALDDADPNVRAAAAENLGLIGHVRAVQPLLEALARPDLALRHTILEALGRTGGPVPAPIVIPFLKEGLLKKAVYRCLGSAGGAEAVPALVAGLAEPAKGVREAVVMAVMDIRDRNPQERAAAEIDALLKGVQGTSVVDGLLTLRDTPDIRMQRALITILGTIGDARAVSSILRACVNESLLPDCLHALRNLGADTESILEEEFSSADEGEKATILRICGEMGERGALPLARKGMDDPAPQVREAAVRAVGRMGLVDLVHEVAALLEDFDQDVRTASLETLALLSGSAAPLVAEIAVSLAVGTDPDKRRNAAFLCGVLRDEERLALLMKDEDDLVRRTAVQGMAALASNDAVQHLTLSLTDENPEVRIAAATALGATGREDALEPLALVTRDEDPWVRCAALRSLGRIGGPRALEAIEATLEGAFGLVCLAALEALGRIGGEKSLELTRRAASSGDDEVVKAAISILADHGDPWLDDHLEDLLRHPHWDVRNTAVRFLAVRQGREAIPVLRRALEREGDALVKGRIVEILERLT
ncbi:HEAT repeat domain-containing protein [bacterium]|nr:HEAT repeat domain-containing protein [bacterium]